MAFESCREAVKKLIEELIRSPGKHDQDAIEQFFKENEVGALPCSHDAFHEKFLENSDGVKKSLQASRIPGFSLTVQRLYQEDRLYLLVRESCGTTSGVQFLKSRLKVIW